MVHQMQFPHFIHLKSLLYFLFSHNMWELQGFFLKIVYVLYVVDASCHHGSIWRHCKNFVHYHLNPHHSMINPLYAIFTWMLFHVFSQRGKRKVSLIEVGNVGDGYAMHT